MKIGYGRVSTAEQNVETQREALITLGVSPEKIHLDRGVSGRRRVRPALDRALGELRDGDELVVTKLDRLGRSLRDLLDIADEIRAKGAALTVGRATYDPADPMGAMMFQVLGMTAEFEVAMNREHTREGVARAKAEGKYKGRQHKLSPIEAEKLRRMHASGDYTAAELGRYFGIHRTSVYRYLPNT
ncbi:recombinase family protein [Dietzia cercidiphylli]|uniref:recombinase family protein n=1 Tax=Dietzia cercidiphylli TaxID=498199 RepID=UPI0015FCD2E2|nr:recombinase family protein [Dietzia cercidiphylli]